MSASRWRWLDRPCCIETKKQNPSDWLKSPGYFASNGCGERNRICPDFANPSFLMAFGEVEDAHQLAT
jgi:hypothetical protein